MASESQQDALMRWTPSQDAVILASSYGSGRIVNELFESVGEKIGKKLDTLAVRSGWGPTEVTKQIEKMLGEGDVTRQSLNNLYNAFGGEAQGHSYCWFQFNLHSRLPTQEKERAL